LRAKAAEISPPLDLEVHEADPPTRTYPEFPAAKFTCPHGVTFWTQPTPTEAARLRAPNGVN
jgi:hypothetical protein